MSYLNANIPADTESVSLGASRIRAMATALNTLIATLWSDAGGFLANVLPGTALTNNSVTSAQLANNAVGSAQLANNAVGLPQTAKQATGSLVTYDANTNPVLVPPGTNGQVLTSNGSTPAWANLPAQAHGIPVFIGPITLLTGASNNSWQTFSGLQTAPYSVPATASALILACYVPNQNNFANVQVRSSATGPVNYLMYQGGNSTLGANSYHQSIYPFTVVGTSVQFDYIVNQGSVNIILVGYIT